MAIAGNYAVESGFDPGINEAAPVVKGSRGGFGLSQWTGPRRKQFEAFAAAQDKPLDDPDVQLDFAVWELNNTEKSARDAIYAADNVEQAARVVSEKLLRPGVPHLDRRIAAARRIAGGETISGGGGSRSMAGGAGSDSLGLDPEREAAIYRAYVDGQMTPQQRAEYERDVRAGRIGIPTGESLFEPVEVSPEQVFDIFEAYSAGRMTEEQAAEYEGDVRTGRMRLPPGAVLGQPAPIQAAIGPGTAPDAATEQAPTSAPIVPLADPVDAPVTPYQPARDLSFDIAGDAFGEGMDLARAGFAGLTGSGPSIGAQVVPEEVMIYGPGSEIAIPPAVREVAGRGVDLGFGVAGLGQAAMGGIAGAAGDVFELLGGSNQSGRRLANDLQAIPEAFAGSPTALARPRVPARPRAPEAPEMLGPPRPPEPPTPAQDALPRLTVEQAEAERKRIGDLAYRASRGDQNAQRELARLADVDPEAAAAAEELGFDLPADVLGRNFQLDEVAAMVRTAKGTQASQQWATTLSQAAERASELVRGGTDLGDVSSVSDAVRRSLQESQDYLVKSAREIYDRIGAQLPKGARVTPSNSVQAINAALEDRSSPDRLDPATKKLFDLVTDENGVTYTDLKDLKGQLFRAKKGQGVYKDAQDWMVNTIYDAISKDMENFVAANLGEDALKQVKSANDLWRARGEIHDRLRDGFGRDMQGDMASLLLRAVSSTKKGSDKDLRKLLSVVPEDMRRGALMAGIEELSRTTSGPNTGSFSFAKFNSLWGGLQNQAAIMVQMRDALGPETFGMLQSLHKVSQKVSKAADPVAVSKRTGASNTAQVFVDGLMARFLDSTAGNVAKSVLAAAIVGGGAQAMGTGGMGAATLAGVAGAGASTLKIGGRRAEAATAFLQSSAFQKAAIEAARNGFLSERTKRKVLRNVDFRRWAKVSNIENPEAWVAGAFAAQQAEQEAE
jgi:hypothetical protein